jgi:hypothetical protein
LTDNSLFADGTAIVESSQLAKAVCMNGMAAWQVLGRLTRAEHVFTTHGTVVLVLVLEAVVCVVYTDTDAHAAFMAMTKVLGATDTAKATVVAMKRLFD